MIYLTSLIQLTFVMSPNVINYFLSFPNKKGLDSYTCMYVIINKLKIKVNYFRGFFMNVGRLKLTPTPNQRIKNKIKQKE